MIRFIGLSLFCILIIGCASSQQAPVIDRMPAPKPETAKVEAKPTDKDWRPATYTVKKGDTLISIGLEYGYDYREIAQANNIQPPYTIYVGQQLKLKQSTAVSNATATDSSDVVITPLDLSGSAVTGGIVSGTPADANAEGALITKPSPTGPPLITEPRALREPYSEQALNAPLVEVKAAPDTQPSSAPAVQAPQKLAVAETGKPEIAAPSTAVTTGGITWSWPTTGKILAGFNDAGNAKGIDIGGTSGQAILAAAPGKVIYSGSDLRGYGKLVIVKHDADFLSVYAHNSKIIVKEGDQVARGQKIAEMGNTDSDKTKLHFEIRRQGKSVDPAAYLPANPG